MLNLSGHLAISHYLTQESFKGVVGQKSALPVELSLSEILEGKGVGFLKNLRRRGPGGVGITVPVILKTNYEEYSEGFFLI